MLEKKNKFISAQNIKIVESITNKENTQQISDKKHKIRSEVFCISNERIEEPFESLTPNNFIKKSIEKSLVKGTSALPPIISQD